MYIPIATSNMDMIRPTVIHYYNTTMDYLDLCHLTGPETVKRETVKHRLAATRSQLIPNLAASANFDQSH